MVSLLPNPDQLQLVESVTGFLAAELPLARLHAADPAAGEARAWQAMADLGWFGLNIDEDLGGSGLGLAESALIFRAFGRHLLSPSVLATAIAARLAAQAGRPDLLTALLAGKSRAAIAQARGGAVIGKESDGGFWLIDAAVADWIVLWDDRGVALLQKAAFTLAAPEAGLDWTLALQKGELNKGAATIWAGDQAALLARQANLLVTAMLVGVSEGARDMGVAYAKVREQFGQPIGAFQAVKHHCANMAVLSEAAWAQTAYSAVRETEGQDAGFDITAARILAADAAIRNGETNIQVHGGIGFTADADPHLFVKRAHLLNQVGGDLRHHQRRLLAEPNAAV